MNIPRKIWVTVLMMAVAIAFGCVSTVLGQPVPGNSTAVLSGYSQQNDVSVMIVPDGSGFPLSNCFERGGTQLTSGKITVTLVDSGGNVVPAYPPNWITLEEMTSPLVWCRNVANPPTANCPNYADLPTDAAGQTTFTLSYYGGSQVQSPTNVWVFVPTSGWFSIPITGNVSFNSPDINGDLLVNLTDIAIFAMDFFGPYNYRSDFNYDQLVAIVDLAMFAPHLNKACPP